MSKMDRLREMREARYAENAKRTPAERTPTGRSVPAATKAATKASGTRRPDPAVLEPEASGTGPAEELCGHRNMGGRTCTRERGHTAKSHRYS